ncbi:hypothetical protein [Natronobiforma cellulositropha]|uniref:hypothetical protein n=1 Tax=Natronobiforma cellulositropha TaxID=1679076 RepID=UPI0021D5D830|nr:hypothetical protein [Natronobiforma cellulositropha]
MPARIPETGRVLVTGPSNVGKTRLTARALERWLATRGPDGVAVLEFAPELERDGRLLGGRLERFTEYPPAVWAGVLEAHAPRAAAATATEAQALARENARRATAILESVPADPAAVFVNDATIPFQHGSAEPSALLARCADADLVVANAFESDELGVDDPLSRRERRVLETLSAWADVHVRLG